MYIIFLAVHTLCKHSGVTASPFLALRNQLKVSEGLSLSVHFLDQSLGGLTFCYGLEAAML